MTMQMKLKAYLEDRERTLAQVRQLLIASLDLKRPPEEIDPDMALFGSGLGLDSIDAVEIVIALETELGVKLEENTARQRALRSVNALVDVVMESKRSQLVSTEIAP